MSVPPKRHVSVSIGCRRFCRRHDISAQDTGSSLALPHLFDGLKVRRLALNVRVLRRCRCCGHSGMIGVGQERSAMSKRASQFCSIASRRGGG